MREGDSVTVDDDVGGLVVSSVVCCEEFGLMLQRVLSRLEMSW